MSDPVKFSIWHVPVPQPRPRFVRRGSLVFTVSNPKGSPIAKFKEAAKRAAALALPSPLAGPVRASFTFLMPRPKRLKGVRREYHTVRPDLDNLVKGLKDALTGICWLDDSQVSSVHAYKLYHAPLEAPGVQVEVGGMQA